MDINQFLSLYDQEMRIDFVPPRGVKEVLGPVIRTIQPAPGTNAVVYSRCEVGQVEEVVREQVQYLKSLGQPFYWTVYAHDQPPDLREHLVAHGLEPEETESFMVLDLDTVPDSLLRLVQVDVRRLTRREELRDLSAVMTAVFGGDAARREYQLGADFDIPGYASMYLGYMGNAPACSGRIYFYPGTQFATLKGGTTLPEYRQHGLYSAVLAARVQEAIGRGCRYLTIEASPMSAPIVARHGFRYLEAVKEYWWRVK